MVASALTMPLHIELPLQRRHERLRRLPGPTILIELIPRVVMISEASAVSFRQNLGDMLNQVQYRHDSIVIKRDGKPVAALVDARLFERIEAGYAEVPEAEGLAEIDVAVAASRAGR